MRHVVRATPSLWLFIACLFCLSVCALGILASLYLLTSR